MASMKYSLPHGDGAAKKLQVTVPSTVQRNVLRCDEKGDTYAAAMYGSNGGYKKLSAAFTQIESICKKALANKAICSSKVKTELEQAKKKAHSQASACNTHSKDLKTIYNVTADICNSINN